MKTLMSFREKYSTNKQAIQKKVTLGGVYALIRNGLLKISDEQREMESKNIDYKTRAIKWILGLLIDIKNLSDDFTEIENMVDAICGKAGVKTSRLNTKGLPQVMECSLIRGQKMLFVSDGQHRYLNYLIDFIRGDIVINTNANLQDAWMEAQLVEILSVMPINGDDTATISWDTLPCEWKEALFDTEVILNCILCYTEEERAHRFYEVNTSKALSTDDTMKAQFGIYPMYKVIKEALIDPYNNSKANEGIVFGFKNEKNICLNAEEANRFRRCFPKKASAIPFIAQNILLSYVGDKKAGKYRWCNSDKQKAEIYKFFEMTKDWREEKCEKYLRTFVWDLCTVFKKVYGDSSINWRERRTFTTGVIYGLYNADNKKEFLAKAHDLAEKLPDRTLVTYQVGEKRDSICFDYLSTSHYNRRRPIAVYNAVSDFKKEAQV